MTIQTVAPFLIPNMLFHRGTWATALSATATACATIDAANEQMAIVFHAPVGGSLTDLLMRTQTVSVTSGPLNFDFRLETVGATGRPSGSLWAANTNISTAVATTDDNIFFTATLTSAATVAQGDKLAFVIKSPGSGTFSMTWGGFAAYSAPSNMFPILASDISPADGTYDTVNVSTTNPSVAVKIGGVWYAIEPFYPTSTLTLNAISTGGTEEYAMRFTCPVGLRVKGASLGLSNVAAGADFTVSIWPDSASAQTNANALGQVTVDGDLCGAVTADGAFNVFFATSITLTAGTVYWIGVRADTATALNVPTLGFVSTHVDAMPGGSGAYLGTRDWSGGSANAFATTTSSTPMFALLCDGIDLPAASGGGLRLAGAGGLAG